MDNPAIQTNGLTRLFGALAAVEDVTLSVAPGQFFGFLGPNGAGKSTMIKMLTGLLEASAGTIEILGQRFGPETRELKRQIGVVPEGMALLGRLTAPEYLHFVGRMYGLDAATTNQRTEELLEFMQLASEHRKLVTDFSHGMQKKLAMAAAVIHGPKVLFLDEPFEGVDVIAAGMLKNMLTGMINRGATIFLTSHVLEIVEQLCSHVAIISKGRLVAIGSLDELRAGVAYALLGFTGLFYNNLGAEGAGIQLLFLSPTPIRTVLLAKNLLHSILFVLVGFAAGVLSCLRLGVPPFVVLAATGAWLVFALPCNLAAGIIFSLTMPYRINPGRIMRPARAQANTLTAALIQLGVLGVGVLVFWLCWSLKSRWLPVPIFLVLAAVAFFVWMRVLHYSDDNANQRRDSLISTLMKAE